VGRASTFYQLAARAEYNRFEAMPLNPGTRLGPYEIVAPIGAGGMGEVYKARDTRLDRIVAIKVSQARFSERFEREAAHFRYAHIVQSSMLRVMTANPSIARFHDSQL
jgi:serine/threonine protein kinase